MSYNEKVTLQDVKKDSFISEDLAVSESTGRMLSSLNRRDRLKSIICDLYEGSVISVGLNVPRCLQHEFIREGLLPTVFNEALKELDKLPVFLSTSFVDRKELWAVFSIDLKGITIQRIKEMLVEIEERHPLGRLFDLDLYEHSSNGLVPLGREDIGRGLRKCFLCSSTAVSCRRMKTHSEEALRFWLRKVINQFCKATIDLDSFLKALGVSISTAITLEAVTTPKAGLVDCRGTGVHKDMDLDMLVSSGAVIGPFMVDCARMGALYGMEGRDGGAELFALLRLVGQKAEKAMFTATSGVNTHKGIVFSGGLLSGAAGLLWAQGKVHALIDGNVSGNSRDFVELVTSEAARIAHGIVKNDLEGLSDLEDLSELTNGERNWIESASSGVRGEAVAGFPSIVKHALPELIYSEGKGYDGNRLRVRILLSLMAVLDDGNILFRGGKIHLAQLQKLSVEALARDNEVTGQRSGVITSLDNESLKFLDDYCLSNNLSSGGAADMLVATLFLDGLWKKLVVSR